MMSLLVVTMLYTQVLNDGSGADDGDDPVPSCGPLSPLTLLSFHSPM
jgi:hypothetical protein